MATYTIDHEFLTAEKAVEICRQGNLIELSKKVKKKIKQCRDFLDDTLQSGEHTIYGINTGFGSLCNVKISSHDLDKLQENLLKSHACGTGAEVEEAIVRHMLLLKIISLSYGYSGIRQETIERLIFFFNEGIHPVVHEQGSLGASGDLAPLAHLCLPLIGLGEVNYRGGKYKGEEILSKFNLEPLTLKAKEGLALLNGTQFMSAYGVYILQQAKKLVKIADIIAGLSIDGFGGKSEPFHKLLHELRPHEGQKQSADNIRQLLVDSELFSSPKKHVQDPYAFRCIPQVHGASRAALTHVAGVMETEINSVTDNPNIFPESGEIISGGNFHGQPLALVLDYLGIALAEMGSISERRVFQLMSGHAGLPVFLVNNPGLNSGLMIAQYTAASIVSQNKQLAAPASVDSITSSNGQEDHVSMGANAATKALRIIENVWTILGIEMLSASQALFFRIEGKTSTVLEKILADYRRSVPPVTDDRVLHDDILNSTRFLKNLKLDNYRYLK